MKQKIAISIPRTTSVRGRLFLEFSVDNLGPSSPFWGVLLTESDKDKLSNSFFSFYLENYCRRGASDHFVRLQQEDLTDVLENGLYVELINPVSPEEEKKIPLFFQNINTFCLLQSSFRSLQRHPNPPFDMYHQKREHDITPSKNSYAMLFEKMIDSD